MDNQIAEILVTLLIVGAVLFGLIGIPATFIGMSTGKVARNSWVRERIDFKNLERQKKAEALVNQLDKSDPKWVKKCEGIFDEYDLWPHDYKDRPNKDMELIQRYSR